MSFAAEVLALKEVAVREGIAPTRLYLAPAEVIEWHDYLAERGEGTSSYLDFETKTWFPMFCGMFVQFHHGPGIAIGP